MSHESEIPEIIWNNFLRGERSDRLKNQVCRSITNSLILSFLFFFIPLASTQIDHLSLRAGVGGGRAIRDRGARLVSEGVLSWASWRRRGKDLVPGGKVPRGRVKRVRSGNNFLTYLHLHLLRATNCETSRNSSLPIVL